MPAKRSLKILREARKGVPAVDVDYRDERSVLRNRLQHLRANQLKILRLAEVLQNPRAVDDDHADLAPLLGNDH